MTAAVLLWLVPLGASAFALRRQAQARRARAQTVEALGLVPEPDGELSRTMARPALASTHSEWHFFRYRPGRPG